MVFKTTHRQRGFSLIELLVSLAIAVLVVGGILLRFRSFDSIVVLKGTAYDVALTLREAQVKSVSAGGGEGASFADYPVGVFFDTGEPNEYIAFYDVNDNSDYDSGTDTIIETYVIPDNYEISDICLDSDCTNPTSLTITYHRPEFDAVFVSDTGPSTASDAKILVSVSTDATQYFTVVAGVTGYISVETP